MLMSEAVITTGVTAMLDKTTLNQLRDMKLNVMASKILEQQAQPDILRISFEERLGMLVDAEWSSKRRRRIERYIRQASFRFEAVIEDIDYHDKHGISKDDMMRLSEGGYITKKQNIIFSGPTGIGKTYLACALGRQACYQYISVKYLRVTDFFMMLSDAHLENRYASFRKKLIRIPLLILDDWGMKPFTIEESHEIMELTEMRYQYGSTIFSGQLPHSKWHELFPDPTLADAILDRIVHNSYKFNLTGESMRKTMAVHQFERDG